MPANFNSNQRLYWSVSRPLRWLGLTLDEWGILCAGLFPGLFMVNSQKVVIGLLLIVSGIVVCYAFKKFKKVSEYFLLKSYLLSKELLPPPSKQFPNMLNKRVGK
jgi:hypothetical protein